MLGLTLALGLWQNVALVLIAKLRLLLLVLRSTRLPLSLELLLRHVLCIAVLLSLSRLRSLRTCIAHLCIATSHSGGIAVAGHAARRRREVSWQPLRLLLLRGDWLLLLLLLHVAGEGLPLLVLRLRWHWLLAYCLHHLHLRLLHGWLHLLRKLLHLRGIWLLVGSRVAVALRCWKWRLLVLRGWWHQLGGRLRRSRWHWEIVLNSRPIARFNLGCCGSSRLC